MAEFSDFIVKPEEFGALGQAAEGLERQTARNQQLAQQREGRKAASTAFANNLVDNKDFLTGTNYDPIIVKKIQDAKMKGAALASKGASTADIMMALGPEINQLNEYSTKAKLVNANTKTSLEKLKAYGGYNVAALQSEALKGAFYNPDGTLKDISAVDPNTDFVSQVLENNPEAVTTGAGFDDFVKKTPTAKYSRNVQTAHAGTTRNIKYEADAPFYMDLERDDKGGIATDAAGNPIGMDVVSSPITGDDNKPIIDPASGKPFRAVDQNHFNAIMQHNPDMKDFIRGQVRTSFKEAGAKDIPREGSPQWNMMARKIMYNELKTRDKSSFKTIDQERQNAAATKIEIAQSPALLKATEEYYDATRKDSSGDGSNLKQFKINPVEAIGRIFGNDPEYTAGEQKTVNGRQVIDVTSTLPGGGLKKGRGEDEVYKSIYFDPKGRSLVVEQEVKDQFGNPKKSLEEVPEASVGQFMRKIAEANNVPLTAVRSILDKMGYQNGKFSTVGSARELKEPEKPKVDASKLTFRDMKNKEVADGKVVEAGERSRMNPKRWTGDAFYVIVKDPNGKEVTKTFSSREKLNEYISGESKPAATQPQQQSGDWRSRAKKVQ